jgi:predicted Zn-dependent peptidase
MTGSLDAAIGYPKHIQAVSVADLIAAAKTYLSPDAYGILTLRPAAP